MSVEDQLKAVSELAASIRREVEGGELGVARVEPPPDRTPKDPPLLATRNGYLWGERIRAPKVKFVAPKARKGEVRLSEFKAREAARCGVSVAVIYERVMAGRYPGIRVRRPHRKFVFVKPPPVLPGGSNMPANGELPLKIYVAMEAARLQTTERAIYVRIYRGKYPQLEFRRVNQRVVFVRVDAGNVRHE